MKFIFLLLLFFSTQVYAGTAPNYIYECGADCGSGTTQYSGNANSLTACQYFGTIAGIPSDYSYTGNLQGQCFSTQTGNLIIALSRILTCNGSSTLGADNTCTAVTPTCIAPQTLNTTTNACETNNTCLPKKDQMISLFSAIASSSQCYQGCQAIVTDGTCANNTAGLQGCHYLSQYSGDSCLTSNATGTAPSNDPAYECIKQGQTYGILNGKTVCVPKTTLGAAPTQTFTAGKVTTIDNGVKTEKATTTTINTTNNTVSTITTTQSGSGAPTTKTETQDLNTYCQTNPNDKNCKTDTVSGNVDGQPSKYTASTFYSSKYPTGLTGVWTNAKANIMASSAGSTITALTPQFGNSGTIPTWSMNFNLGKLGNFGQQTLTIPAYIWNILSIIFIVSSLFVARGLILGG